MSAGWNLVLKTDDRERGSKMDLPDETGPEAQSKASKSFQKGTGIHSDSGRSAEEGSGTVGLEKEAVETSYCQGVGT